MFVYTSNSPLKESQKKTLMRFSEIKTYTTSYKSLFICPPPPVIHWLTITHEDYIYIVHIQLSNLRVCHQIHHYKVCLVSCGGVRLSPLSTSVTHWSIVPAPNDTWVWSSRWNENWQGKSKYSEQTCPNDTLSTTNPTWPGLGSNPGHRGGKPATNHLSYGAALRHYITTRLNSQHTNGNQKRNIANLVEYTWLFLL
jgi:hypothetical protein